VGSLHRASESTGTTAPISVVTTTPTAAVRTSATADVVRSAMVLIALPGGSLQRRPAARRSAAVIERPGWATRGARRRRHRRRG